MPKSNQAGVSYAGHTDNSPDDVEQPEWQRDGEAPEQEQAAEETPAPRATRKAAK